MKEYNLLEHKVIDIFRNNPNFTYQNQKYFVRNVGKPRPKNHKGECKTDVYLELFTQETIKELKISCKLKGSYEFQESKISAERAEAIFGNQWSTYLENATKSIQSYFIEHPLIYLESYGNTHKGSVTMGWRLEILNKKRKLSIPMFQDLTRQQIINSFYKGDNLEIEKRNALVGDKSIPNSGVANSILITDLESCDSPQNILKALKLLDNYEPEPLYLAFVANNYRTCEQKIDGSRPLVVSVDWFVQNEQIHRKIEFEHPLEKKGKFLAVKFQNILSKYNVTNILELNKKDVAEQKIIYRG